MHTPLTSRHVISCHVIRSFCQGKRLVLVDGVGYPAVGSVAGCSNADVAATLHAPVMIVGRPGVGNAIDR